MKNDFGQFSKETLAQFAEEYSFRTCQRGDGSYYGTGGQCRKGTETDKVEKESKEKKGKATAGALDSSDPKAVKAAMKADGIPGSKSSLNRQIESDPALSKQFEKYQAAHEVSNNLLKKAFKDGRYVGLSKSDEAAKAKAEVAEAKAHKEYSKNQFAKREQLLEKTLSWHKARGLPEPKWASSHLKTTKKDIVQQAKMTDNNLKTAEENLKSLQ